MRDNAGARTDQVFNSIPEISVCIPSEMGVVLQTSALQILISKLLHNSCITYINSYCDPIVYKTEA